jgi:uncharacterized protein (TIGR00251 family)
VIEIRESPGSVSFLVRVQPGASRTAISGEWQGAVRIRIAAPARDDRANEALIRLLADRFKVPAAAVKITHGEHNRTKRVEVQGASAPAVRALIPPEAAT